MHYASLCRPSEDNHKKQFERKQTQLQNNEFQTTEMCKSGEKTRQIRDGKVLKQKAVTVEISIQIKEKKKKSRIQLSKRDIAIQPPVPGYDKAKSAFSAAYTLVWASY